MLVELHRMSLVDVREFYARVAVNGDREVIRWLCRNDRYFLLVCVLGLTHMNNEWCYARCREVEAEPDGFLDLWSRGHYKSTIITLGGVVQEVLRDPEIAVCILSYNSPTAQKFVNQIKAAFENETLISLFPAILHEKKPRENWSVQKGLWVKRESLGKEPTVMGSGLVDGMPTGMHFKLRVYDDVVTMESVSTPDQIAKTTEAFRLSDALGTGDGQRVWMVGTRYHPMDTYRSVLEAGTAVERRRICVDEDGEPLLLSREALEQKRRDMGPRVFAAQMLQNPAGEGVAYFQEGWLEFYDVEQAPNVALLNVYMLVDSAHAKRKSSDYTTIWIVGLGRDRNYYVLDVVRDRLNLAERTDAVMRLHRKWRPIRTWWEQVGAMSDVQHVREIMARDGYRFAIDELAQRVAKRDRIGWLIPLFEAGRIILPRRLTYRSVAGEVRDLVDDFVRDEYGMYPVVSHDDMLDCLANVQHSEVADQMRWPMEYGGDRAACTVDDWDPYATKKDALANGVWW